MLLTDSDQAMLHGEAGGATRTAMELLLATAEAEGASELLDISAELDLYKVYMELVPAREDAAIEVVESLGFKKVATLSGRIRDYYGSYRDVVVLEIPLSDRTTWWRE